MTLKDYSPKHPQTIRAFALFQLFLGLCTFSLFLDLKFVLLFQIPLLPIGAKRSRTYLFGLLGGLALRDT